MQITGAEPAGEKKKQAEEKQASGVERQRPENVPLSFKSAVWLHFGFNVEYNDVGMKTVNRVTVCKRCLKNIPYTSGNTTNSPRGNILTVSTKRFPFLKPGTLPSS